MYGVISWLLSSNTIYVSLWSIADMFIVKVFLFLSSTTHLNVAMVLFFKSFSLWNFWSSCPKWEQPQWKMWRRVAFKNQMSTGYMLKYFAHFFIMLRQNVADKIAHYEFLHTHRQWLITHGAFIGAERVNVISRWFNLSGSSLLVFSCTMESHFWHEVVVSSIARPDKCSTICCW